MKNNYKKLVWKRRNNDEFQYALSKICDNTVLDLKILEAITNKAEELGIKINAAVVDEGANLKAFIRMDEAALLSSEIAQNKAYTAAAFGKPTHEWYPMIKDEPALLTGIVHTNKLVVFGGGIPLTV